MRQNCGMAMSYLSSRVVHALLLSLTDKVSESIRPADLAGFISHDVLDR